MQPVTNTILTIGSIGLLAAGAYLCLLDRPASAATSLGFGFLLLVLLLLAKFKRFKGFGFEAEMWEEEQVKAAALVDRLSLLSEAVTTQMALIAARIGLWDSSFSIPEMAALLEQIEQLLAAANVSQSDHDKILSPLYTRIELDYWNTARGFLERVLRREAEQVHAVIPSTPRDDREPLNQRSQLLSHDLNLLHGLPYAEFRRSPSLKPISALAHASPFLSTVPDILKELNELDLDLQHFIKNRSVRRKIDVSYLRKQ
jgi:hypothetical protein